MEGDEDSEIKRDNMATAGEDDRKEKEKRNGKEAEED